MHGSQLALGAGTERMPTFRQRLLSLASGDGEKRAAWLAAYKFARQVNETQVAHVEGQERRILPQGVSVPVSVPVRVQLYFKGCQTWWPCGDNLVTQLIHK